MGRQITVALTEDGEHDFLEFMRSSADVQLLVPFSQTREELFVDRFAPKGDGHWCYGIWNKTFSWTPEFSRTRTDLPDPRRRGLYYISNKSSGPLLEYTRHSDANGSLPGRIYWAKNFSAPDGLGYDVASFEIWYQSMVKWLRKHHRRPLTL